MSLTREGQIYEELAHVYEKRYGVSFEKETENNEYMIGHVNRIHPLTNGGGNKVYMTVLSLGRLKATP